MYNKQEDKINEKSSQLTDKTKEFGLAVENLTHNIGRDLGAAARDVKDKTSHYMQSTRSYVSEHPLQSIAMAALTGAAIGKVYSVLHKK